MISPAIWLETTVMDDRMVMSQLIASRLDQFSQSLTSLPRVWRSTQHIGTTPMADIVLTHHLREPQEEPRHSSWNLKRSDHLQKGWK
jgi:ABC-type bacteriocin/lantibiotic exporter with double-glycine peptidase domain